MTSKYIWLFVFIKFVFYSCIQSGLTNAAMEKGLVYQSSLHYIHPPRFVSFTVLIKMQTSHSVRSELA